jgi:integrase
VPLLTWRGCRLTRADAYALLSGLADRPAVQRILKMELSATWEHAMACGLMPDGSNPWAKQRVAPAGKKDRVLSDAEVSQLVSWLRGDGLNPTARDVLLLTLGTGCRSGEVVSMRWGDLDLETGRVATADQQERTRADGVSERLDCGGIAGARPVGRVGV